MYDMDVMGNRRNNAIPHAFTRVRVGQFRNMLQTLTLSITSRLIALQLEEEARLPIRVPQLCEQLKPETPPGPAPEVFPVSLRQEPRQDLRGDLPQKGHMLTSVCWMNTELMMVAHQHQLDRVRSFTPTRARPERTRLPSDRNIQCPRALQGHLHRRLQRRQERE